MHHTLLVPFTQKELFCLLPHTSHESLPLFICSLFPGYGITLEAFTTLFNRFATKRKYMKPEDFARCLCRLKTMNGNVMVIVSFTP